jgi:small nuclear ribonucleoprotein (snRNP)-like protein
VRSLDFERVVEALVFSFVIYICYVPLNDGKLPFHIEHDPTGRIADTVLWEPAQLAWLAAVTAAFALLTVAYIRLDGNRLFRAVGLTERTTRNSIWNDILEHEAIDNQPVQVELADGRNLLGVLLYYSDVSEDGSLYLTQASWVDSEGRTISIPGPGILLTRNSGIRCVSLLDPAPDTSGV